MSIDGGLSALVDAVAAASRTDIRLSTTVRELRRTATGWEAVTGPVPAPKVIEADAVVIAVPSRPAAKLLADVAPDASAAVADLDYASVALALFAFDHADLPRRSGLLIPAEAGRAVKAATFFTAKWPHLESRYTLVRASIGRYGEEAVLQRSDEELARVALAELGERLGKPLPEPVAWRVDRWGGSLPQYGPGHGERVAAARTALADHKGLAVAGAAFDGVGIAACVASGRAAADRICEHIGSEGP
jgi:oxygen-dependent protoporphyrinogen oxidase